MPTCNTKEERTLGQAQVRWCSSEQVTLCFNLLQFPTYFTISFLFLAQGPGHASMQHQGGGHIGSSPGKMV